MVLELFLNEKTVSHQLRASQLLQSSFTSYLRVSSHDSQRPTLPAMAPLPDLATHTNDLLDKTIDALALDSHETRHEAGPGRAETLFHVLAILKCSPLKLLHRATGWQANKEQKLESIVKLRHFFHQRGPEARKCLWHATCIFSTARSSRLLACYDVFSLMVAMCYIYCYCEVRLDGHDGGNIGANAAAPTQAPLRRAIVRLDQLRGRSAIETWIASDDEALVHLTGVGLLDGPHQGSRFLRAVERTLTEQVAWRGFCRAFAGSFAQLRRGETPSIPEPRDC